MERTFESEHEDFYPEDPEIDYTFNIRSAIYEALENTISDAIDKEMQSKPKNPNEPVPPKAMILKKVLEKNFEVLEDECFLTTGPDNKIYVCGQWLFRPILWNGNMISMMEHLKSRLNLPEDKIIFIPTESGVEVRKRLWGNEELSDGLD
ncbi:MAG: hypothetical protein KBT11_11520 [Treponema sp.]|nr:hypothetical protein [Candidatus Treponema equifaecale]